MENKEFEMPRLSKNENEQHPLQDFYNRLLRIGEQYPDLVEKEYNKIKEALPKAASGKVYGEKFMRRMAALNTAAIIEKMGKKKVKPLEPKGEK